MRCFLSVVFVASLAGALTAQTAVVNRKLSGPMSAAVTSDVVGFTFSPAGDRVAYTVVRGPEVTGSGGPTRIEVASSDGTGTPLSLTPEEPEIEWLRWTPDASGIVFTVTESGRRTIEVVPADGSAAPTVLFAPGTSQDVAENLAAEDVEITADGSHVIFRHEAGEFPFVYRLASVPVAGGVPIQINGALAPNGDVVDFVMSGETVVYRADEVNGWTELFSVPADGSAPRINLSQIALASQSVVEGIAVDPTGARAVYMAIHSNSQRVFSVPVDGSAPAVALSPILPSGRDVSSFRVSPDGTRVVYRANPTDGDELFVVPIDGSTAAVPLVPGESVSATYEFSPDSAHVVYRADDYFSVRLSDGAIVELYTGSARNWKITPDSARVVLLSFGLREIYSARLDGTTPAILVNPDFVPGGQVDAAIGDEDAFAISPDSQRVVYRADADTIDVQELYWVDLVPSGPPVATKLNATLPADGDVLDFLVAPSSTFVLHRAYAEIPAVAELVRAPEQVAINDPLPAATAGDALSFVVRNGRVAYVADQDVDDIRELFSAPADGSAPSVKLNGPLVTDGDVAEVGLSPDGSTVLFTADADLDVSHQLFSVPADGSAPPTQLNAPLHDVTSASGFLVSPDGARVVYEAYHEGTPGFRLYSVPIHGGTPVELGPDPWGFEVAITPDSTRVVFRTLSTVLSAPIDGSAPVILLSGAASIIPDFELTPDGSRVVYTATASGVTRLYSASVLGGAPVDLSGTLVSGGNVAEFALSVDGQRVVYRADRLVDERFLLSSVPVTGGSSLVLNGPMVAEADVLDFRVSPGGVDLVYLADQELDGSEHLYRVPVNGSSPAVLLIAQDLDNAPFEIAPDGAHVVVTLDGLQSLPITGGSFVQLSSSAGAYLFTPGGRHVVHTESSRLMLSPIEGGLSVPLAPAPAGTTWNFALDGGRVIYRSEQDMDDVVELYSSWLDVQPTQHAPPWKSGSVLR